ncbi:hypothetical protein FACS189451_04040 [Bacteroidia bacterium]|nr:hypothetical protein FACS189446_1840 [Bacteroidia bacterium]GHT61617.1 hypothetical protein FACS189451_04040 [Bacteroidia bacterium]
MKIIYKVYRKGKDEIPILSLNELPSAQLKTKKSFTGKKAKIEAILRTFKVQLDSSSSAAEINAYIGENVFNTHRWNEYYNTLNQVLNERFIVGEELNYLYDITVVLKDDILPENFNFNDERMIHLVTWKLLNKPIGEYGGIINPILSVEINKY